MKLLGIPDDSFIEHGTPEDLYRECGTDVKGITQAVLKLLGRPVTAETSESIA